jgi:WD40 repeat protein
MDGSAKVWNTQTGQVLELRHDDEVNYATFNPDNSLVATASSDHTAKVWRLSDGKDILTIPHTAKVVDVKFSSDGKMVGSAGGDGVAQIWRINDRTKIFSILHNGKINHLLFSPNNQWVITASDDHSIQIWDLNDQKMLYQLTQSGAFIDIAITSNNKYIISGDTDGHVIVWDTQQGQQVFSTQMGSNSIMRVAISSDDKLFAAGNEAGGVCVWQLDNAEKKLCFSATEAVWDIGFSSSDFVIAGSLDGYVYIFDLVSKQEYVRISNWGMVLSLDISPDNRYLAISTTTGYSSTVLWKKEDVILEACKRLPRQLSEEEWKEYLGEDKYDPFCVSYSFK